MIRSFVLFALIALLALIGSGCPPAPDATVVVLGTPTVSAADVAERVEALLGRTVVAGPPLVSTWETCAARGGSRALRAAAAPPRTGGTTIVITDQPVAVDQSGAPCTRVFGAAPTDRGIVIVSDRELRGRCSSMPHVDAVAAVAVHELGHALGLTVAGDGVTCDGRGCHCDGERCLMNDDRGGCPQPGEALCSRCAR